jgi:zinc transport system ATP-binding protein
MAGAPLIKAENITLKRGGKTILDRISMEIKEGDFLTIVGPNGAGKTSLLKIIAGITKPDMGTVERAPALKIGYVPQRFVPDPTLPITADYFLSLGTRSDKKRRRHVMELAGIGHLSTRMLHVLSGGEIQRLLLARALIHQPQLLVLDEPAQNLDISGELSLYTLINQLHKDMKLSILMVSHDLHMVMASTTRVLCLFHHICCWGSPEHVMKDPAFKEVFGDEMSRLMAFYQHSHEHHHDLHHPHETIADKT